jgi:hypothetical protein
MTTTILKENHALRIAILPINQLKPHEKGSPLYFELIRKEILKDGVLRYPIVADEKTHVILDGMHRWLALKSLGHSLIPVLAVSVSEDNGIHVGRRRIHRYALNPADKVPIKKVIETGLSGNLMEPRSTRHFFPFSKLQRIDYPLDLLGKGPPQDVSEYLAKMDERVCQSAIREWLEELSEEIEFLAKRKEEVEGEMREFISRVKSLDNGISIY